MIRKHEPGIMKSTEYLTINISTHKMDNEPLLFPISLSLEFLLPARCILIVKQLRWISREFIDPSPKVNPT